MDHGAKAVYGGRSAKYAAREYWDVRFKTETAHEWLCTWPQLRELLLPYLVGLGEEAVECRDGETQDNRSVLILGNGSSSLPLELAREGRFARIIASDFSEVVTASMAARHGAAEPRVSWRVADMLALPPPGEERFDAVLDKGGLDALLVGGDVWAPPRDLLAAAQRVCEGVHASLKPGGVWVSVSFAQPHFRLHYLLQQVGGGGGCAGDGGNGGAGNGDGAASMGDGGGASCAGDGCGADGAGDGGGVGGDMCAVASSGDALLAATSEGATHISDSDSEWEPDVPAPARAQAPTAQGTLWAACTVVRVDAGLGYHAFVLTKSPHHAIPRV